MKLAKQQAAKLENVFEQMGEGAAKSLAVIIKADVQGSYEGLAHAWASSRRTRSKSTWCTPASAPSPNRTSIFGAASKAIVIGFNARADAAARKLVKTSGVQVRYYNIIYEAVDDVKNALTGFSPEIKENILGLVDIRNVFKISRWVPVAGCFVLEGLVKRGSSVRLLRDNVVIFTGGELIRLNDSRTTCARSRLV